MHLFGVGMCQIWVFTCQHSLSLLLCSAPSPSAVTPPNLVFTAADHFYFNFCVYQIKSCLSIFTL